MPFFPFGSAFPGRPRVTAHPTVRSVAAALHVTPAQVGLAWLLAHAPNTLLIPGTTSLTHLDENIATEDVHLGPNTRAILDDLVPLPRSGGVLTRASGTARASA